MFTLVVLSFHSEHLIEKLVKNIPNNIPIIIIENSKNIKLKKKLEVEFKNVQVFIPEENLGFSKGMNLGIQKSKTDLVFLNPADVILNKNCIDNLLKCTKVFTNFTLLAPTYKDESVYKNYEVYFEKKNELNIPIASEFGIKEVDFIDGTFIVNKKELESNYLLDENIFIYFETMDLAKRLKKLGKKMYVCEKIKFEHLGSQSHDVKYNHEAKLSRNWHYCWSKFYYYKKNVNYLHALKKTLPFIIKTFFICLKLKLLNKTIEYSLSRAELNGSIASVLLKKSNYRPYK